MKDEKKKLLIELVFYNYGNLLEIDNMWTRDKKSTGLFIGFIGVPGVGKSTVASELARILNAKVFIEPGEEAYPINNDQPWQNQVATLENWVCETNLKNFRDARELANSGNITIADAGIFLVNQELIFEPAYAWWYGLIPEKEKNKICQNAKSDWLNAPCPDILVLFETDEETWLRFLKQRGRGTDSDENCLRTYLDQQKVMAQAAEKFAHSRKISFVKFNNEYGSPEKSATLLCNNLSCLISDKIDFKYVDLTTPNEQSAKFQKI